MLLTITPRLVTQIGINGIKRSKSGNIWYSFTDIAYKTHSSSTYHGRWAGSLSISRSKNCLCLPSSLCHRKNNE